MMMNEPRRFEKLRGTLARDAALARYTTWRCGGPADRLYVPADRDDLASFLRQLPGDEPVVALGLGSNTLVRDGGIRGTVVILHNPGAAIAIADGLVYADAGVACPKLARFAALHGCADAEFLAGIPGTVGGALAMNAGCYGGETWRHVIRVEVVASDGRFEVRTHADYAIGYRSVRRAGGHASDGIFTAAWFSFPRGRRDGGARAHQGAARAAHRHAASRSAQCRQRVPESAGRSCRAADRALRPQGLRDRRRKRVRKARELHREPSPVGEGRRHRGADRARARNGAIEDRNRARARSAHHRGAAMTSGEFGKVAVLMGGPSAEREISFLSGNAVLKALREKGVDAHAFDPAERDVWALKEERFDRVFIALHGRFGEDGTVQGALETLKIPYTGSGVMASALAMDKWRTKLVWQASGIPTPRYRVVTAATDWMRVVAELGLPLIVKPAREGSTIGITKIATVDHGELAAAHVEAAKHDDLVLVEEFVAGTELTVGDPRSPSAAGDPDRGAAGQLRLSPQVFFRRDEVLLPVRAAGGCRARDPGGLACRIRHRRLQRLGAARPHPARGRFLFVSRSQHVAGHDRAFARADGGEAGGHPVRRPVRDDPARRPCGMTRGS